MANIKVTSLELMNGNIQPEYLGTLDHLSFLVEFHENGKEIQELLEVESDLEVTSLFASLGIEGGLHELERYISEQYHEM